MNHPSHDRDPLDGPPPKWKPHRPEPLPIQDYWAHIPNNKRPSAKVMQQTSPQLPSKTPAHGSVSPDVKKKVAKITSSPPSTSPFQETSDIQRPAITGNEEFIANRILQISDMHELCDACSDPSGVKFQALCAPLIKRLSQFVAGETINSEHVLFLLRQTLKITIPKK